MTIKFCPYNGDGKLLEKVGEIGGVNLRVERVETVELAELFQCFQCSKRGGKRGDFLLYLLLSFPLRGSVATDNKGSEQSLPFVLDVFCYG